MDRTYTHLLSEGLKILSLQGPGQRPLLHRKTQKHNPSIPERKERINSWLRILQKFEFTKE